MDVFVKHTGLGEWRALEHFGAAACVKVLGYDNGTLSLERIQPGTRLADVADDDLATTHLCDVAARLHARGMPDGEWPTVEDWGRGFHGQSGIPADHVDRAAEMYATLAATQTTRCLLHGDLHQSNILLHHERGWLAIDPKGVVGEPAYEFGAALRQAHPARISIISERLGLDRRRVAGWAYAQAVLSAIWCIEDGTDPTWAMAAAQKLLIQAMG